MIEALAAPKINFVADTPFRFEDIQAGEHEKIEGGLRADELAALNQIGAGLKDDFTGLVGETNNSKGNSRIGSLVLTSLSPRDECMLSDVDDLARYSLADGVSYDPEALTSISQNKITAVKEGAMPFARSRVEQAWEPAAEGRRGGIIRALGRTAVETAERGRLFYRYAESLAFCDVDVAYAKYNQANLRPNVAHVMIGSHMTPKDGSRAIAKAEGLANTDSLQINWLALDEHGQPTAAVTETILVASVPTEAWVNMLADAGNIFGKSIMVNDPESGLSIMKTFSALDIPIDKLTEGPVTILAAVLPYITDSVARQKVAEHLQEFRGNQREMHERALSPAERWLQFDMATEQSLRAGLANAQLQSFIESLAAQWGEDDAAIINSHKLTKDGKVAYQMTRQLAVILQNAQRNFLLTAAAVVTGNKAVLKQMDSAVAERIRHTELNLAAAHASGVNIQLAVAANNRLIATQNTIVGGGCSGTNQARFKIDSLGVVDDLMSQEIPELTDAVNGEINSWHGGKVKKGNCVNCKKNTDVGVKNWCEQCISGHCGSKKVAPTSITKAAPVKLSIVKSLKDFKNKKASQQTKQEVAKQAA